jgi:hypothetical protein
MVKIDDMPVVWGEEPKRDQAVPFDIEHLLPTYFWLDATLPIAPRMLCIKCSTTGACVMRVHLGDHSMRTCFGCKVCGFRWWFNRF